MEVQYIVGVPNNPLNGDLIFIMMGVALVLAGLIWWVHRRW